MRRHHFATVLSCVLFLPAATWALSIESSSGLGGPDSGSLFSAASLLDSEQELRFSWEIASTNRSARIDPWGGNSFDLSLEASVPRNEIGSAALGAGPLRDATGVETPFKDLLASLDIAASDGGASAALREAAQRGQR